MSKNITRLSIVGLVLLGLMSSLTFVVSYRSKQLQTLNSLSPVEVKDVSVSCASETQIIDVECVLENLRLSQTQEREMASLSAQQDVAVWTFGLMVLGVISLVLSALGLFALIWTFIRTRQLSEDQSRAYVLTLGFTVSKIYNPEDNSRYQIYISFDIHNTGHTPALDVVTVSRLGWSDEATMLDWSPIAPPTSRGVLGPQQKVQQSRTIPEDYTDPIVLSNVSQGTTVWARGVVRYQDVFGQSWQHSFMWHLKDPERLLSKDGTSEKDGVAYKDFSMTVHAEENELKKLESS